MRRSSIAAFTLLSLSWPSCAAPASVAMPRAATSAVASADARTSAIDALFLEWQRRDSPGCAVGVMQNGKLVLARGFGQANLEHEIPIAPNTVFDIGSTSKQFTAACVVLLEQEKKLSLSDDVRKYVPELHEAKPVITLRMLLNHTSGLRDYLTLMTLAGARTEDWTTKEDTLALLARQTTGNFEPGTEFLYSNTGYFLLSIVVERAAGKTLPEYAKERIFEPLGMKDTHIHDDHTRVVPRRATGYSKRDDGTFGIDMSDYEQTGDGAVMTTIEDLARWDENFYTGKVGGKALVDALQTKGRLADGKELDYALGLRHHEHRGLQSIAHGGSWAGYRAELLRFPGEHVSIVCLCNLGNMNPSELALSVADVWLADRLSPEPPAATKAPRKEREKREPWVPAASDKAAFCGVFHCDELGVDYEITQRDDELRCGIAGRETFSLKPAVEKNEFRAGGTRLHAHSDAQGSVTGFTLDSGRVRGLAFVRRSNATNDKHSD